MPREAKFTVAKIVIIGVIILVLQIYFIPIIEITVWRPDLVLLLTLYIGYSYGVMQGTISGFSLGLLQDALSPNPIGISSLANCIVGFLAGQGRQLKLAYNAKILLTILLILIHGSIFFLLYQFKTEATYLYLLFTRVFPNTIYTFLIGLLISVFMRSKLSGI
jgi:rod shape-determining protein MreD